MKTYHEKVFEEKSKIIVDNLELLYNYNDNPLGNYNNCGVQINVVKKEVF